MSRVAKRPRPPAPARTLKNLRRDATAQDRNLPALAPEAGGASRFVPSSYRASTLDDLREQCGRFADVAMLDAQYAAIEHWFMSAEGELALANPQGVATTALVLCRPQVRARAGMPCFSGKPHDATLLSLSPEAQAEAWRVMAETLEDWRAAGSPHLANACQKARDTVRAAFRFMKENGDTA